MNFSHRIRPPESVGGDARTGVSPADDFFSHQWVNPAEGDASIGVVSPEWLTNRTDDEIIRRHPMFGMLPTLMAFAMAAPIESKRKEHKVIAAPALQLPSILRSSQAAVDDHTLQTNSKTQKDKPIKILKFNLQENIKTIDAEGVLRKRPGATRSTGIVPLIDEHSRFKSLKSLAAARRRAFCALMWTTMVAGKAWNGVNMKGLVIPQSSGVKTLL